ADSLPDGYEQYCQHATLVDERNLQAEHEHNCFVAVGKNMEWPFLVVAVGRVPKWTDQEIRPEVLVLPTTSRMFLGGQERLHCYDLDGPMRLWEDREDPDREFWGWRRHGKVVLMAAELELTAWDSYGRKQWTTFVEPPWTYRIEADAVQLTVLGVTVSFPLEVGPMWG